MIDLAPLVAASMLTLESQVWVRAGVKEQVVRDAFDITMVRYYLALNALLDTELALQLDPVVTNRLRRIRETRRLVG